MLTSSAVLALATSIPFAILGIGFLIFIHEFGHYLACRFTRTRVETFSIGFGPRLFGWESKPGEKRRFTWGKRTLDPADLSMDFRVAVVPLGGYVKMAGETPGDVRTGSPDEFASKPMRSRILIVVAGVCMNAITAVAFYFIAIAGGVSQIPPLMGHVVSGGPAWEAGIKPGDRVVELDGTRTPTFLDLQMEIAVLSPDEKVPIVVEREGKRVELEMTPRYMEERGFVQIQVAPARELVLGKPPETFVVGATETVTVAGLAARGGVEAHALIHDAFQSGVRPVVVARADGSKFTLDAVPLVPAARDVAKAVFRIGVEPWGGGKVVLARGAAAALKPGDELRSARSGDQRILLDTPSALRSLAFLPSLDELVVHRGEGDASIPLALSSPAQVAAFLDDLGVEAPTDNRVTPLTRSLVSVTEDERLVRYPSIPAAAVGILPATRITRVGRKVIEKFTDLHDALEKLENADELTLTVKDEAGVEREVKITPVAWEVLGDLPLLLRESREPFRSEGLGDAAGLALRKTWHDVRNVFRTIGGFFTGSINFTKNVAGPITIVRASAGEADQDLLQLLWFLAYISVMLAVLNILPVPVLDGGHLLFMACEKIKGRPLKEETIGKMQFVGFALLMLLMFFAIKNDIGNL